MQVAFPDIYNIYIAIAECLLYISLRYFELFYERHNLRSTHSLDLSLISTFLLHNVNYWYIGSRLSLFFNAICTTGHMTYTPGHVTSTLITSNKFTMKFLLFFYLCLCVVCRRGKCEHDPRQRVSQSPRPRQWKWLIKRYVQHVPILPSLLQMYFRVV